MVTAYKIIAFDEGDSYCHSSIDLIGMVVYPDQDATQWGDHQPDAGNWHGHFLCADGRDRCFFSVVLEKVWDIENFFLTYKVKGE